MRILLDANRILRYLLSDIPEQVEAVAKAVERRRLYGVGVIRGMRLRSPCAAGYGFPRGDVADALSAVLDRSSSSMRRPCARRFPSMQAPRSTSLTACLTLAIRRKACPC